MTSFTSRRNPEVTYISHFMQFTKISTYRFVSYKAFTTGVAQVSLLGF